MGHDFPAGRGALRLGCGLLLLAGCTSQRAPHLREVPEMETVTSKDGTVIGYWMSGPGPPLLLVHGTTADHRRWAAVSPRLERHFSVFAMDRRGRGGSTDAPDYDGMRETEDAAAVRNRSGERADGPAHCYGAGVSH